MKKSFAVLCAISTFSVSLLSANPALAQNENRDGRYLKKNGEFCASAFWAEADLKSEEIGSLFYALPILQIVSTIPLSWGAKRVTNLMGGDDQSGPPNLGPLNFLYFPYIIGATVGNASEAKKSARIITGAEEGSNSAFYQEYLEYVREIQKVDPGISEAEIKDMLKENWAKELKKDSEGRCNGFYDHSKIDTPVAQEMVKKKKGSVTTSAQIAVSGDPSASVAQSVSEQDVD